MSYDSANRLTTSLLGTTQLTTYTYSNAGEMTGERCDNLGIRATFVYDGEHRCVNEIRATTHSYTYAFDGLRRSAHMAGTANAISFVWDGTDLLNEYVPGGLSGRYLTLDGEVLSEKRGASRYVYGVDPLGSVVHLLDSSLNRAATYVYWPYGEVQSHTGVDTPMQFVGNLGYYTSTTNRQYVRARWLRPDLGRWMTEDPIGFEGGDWNVYGYVSGMAATAGDSNGLLGPCAVACIGCAVCLLDAGLACIDCGTDPDCWLQCVQGVLANLPPWLRLGCDLACGGCLACAGRCRQPRPGPGVPGGPLPVRPVPRGPGIPRRGLPDRLRPLPWPRRPPRIPRPTPRRRVLPPEQVLWVLCMIQCLGETGSTPTDVDWLLCAARCHS